MKMKCLSLIRKRIAFLKLIGSVQKFTEKRRRCLEQDENAENTNQPPPMQKPRQMGQLQSQGLLTF